MRGGLGYRKFYYSEVKRIEEAYKKSLPLGGYTPEEMEAGYQRLADQFGFFSTLLFMEKETPYTRDELLEWPVGKFQYNLCYIAWKNYIDKKYGDIIKKKGEKK